MKLPGELINYIDRKYCPSKREWKEIMDKSEEVRRHIFFLIGNEYSIVEEDLVLLGSVPRMTYLKDDYDIDLFIRLEKKVDIKSFIEFLINRIRKDPDYKTRIRYAEHPYIELYVKDLKFNIVPSYKTTYPNWLSPIDRSYFHHLYLVEKGISELYKEVVRLKAFLKASGVYGAEVYIGGFSGYLVELLILKYGSMEEAIYNMSRWTPPIIIDLEGRYTSYNLILDAFGHDVPLIIVDPIDKGRNVAAAVKRKNFSKIISATKYFISNPTIKFFKESPHLHGSKSLFYKYKDMIKPDLPILIIYMEHGERIEDIHYSQLERVSRKLKNVAEKEGFKIFKIGVYSDYISCSAIFLLFSELEKPKYERVKGPYPYMSSEEKFLSKNSFRIKWIDEDGRWYTLKESRYLKADELIKHIIDNRLIRIPSEIYDQYSVIVMKENQEMLLNNPLLSKWLTNFVVGDEFWTLPHLLT